MITTERLQFVDLNCAGDNYNTVAPSDTVIRNSVVGRGALLET